MSRSHYRLALLGTCAERLSALKQLSRQFQIVSTPSPDLREALCPPTNGAPTLPAAIGTMLENPQIDILDINLPAQWHLPVTLQALKSGKHVICDAPVAADPDAIAQIDEAAAAAQRLVFPAFPNRHGRAIRVLSALQRRALLGPLRCATLEIHRASTAPVHTAEIAATGSFACHIHDLLGVIDGPVAEVSAATARSGRGDSSAVIWMRMASGALVSSAVLQGTGRNHCRLRLEFDHATVESGPDPDHPTTQDWVITPRDCARRKEFPRRPKRPRC